jgi:hypothetical protein
MKKRIKYLFFIVLFLQSCNLQQGVDKDVKDVTCKINDKDVDCSSPDISSIPSEYKTPEPVKELQVNNQLAGERPVIIQVGFAPPNLIVRSSVSWGYLDKDGNFVSSGIGVLDHKGGVVTGVISSVASPKEILVKVIADYLNPSVQDEEKVYTVPVEVNGAHLLIDLTSNKTNNSIILKMDCELTTEDYLVLSWNKPSSGYTKQQQGVDWLFWPTLIKSKKGLIVRNISIPRIEGNEDSKIDWILSGILSKKKIVVNGSVPTVNHTMMLRIDVDKNVWVDGAKQN